MADSPTPSRWATGLRHRVPPVVALLVGLSVASFQKRFTAGRHGHPATDRIGSQLQPASDVKIRGLIVGRGPLDRSNTGRAPRSAWPSSPTMVAQIPANVQRPAAAQDPVRRALRRPRAAGRRTRPADRRGRHHPAGPDEVAIELEKVFDDLLPLLRAVQPAKLSATLNALATTLDGPRRPRSARTSSLVDTLLQGAQPAAADHPGRHLAASPTSRARMPWRAPDLLRARRGAASPPTRRSSRRGKQLAGFLAGTAGSPTRPPAS